MTRPDLPKIAGRNRALDEEAFAPEIRSPAEPPDNVWLELLAKYARFTGSLRQSSRLKQAGQILERLPIAKDLMLVIRPAATWQRIATERRGALFIFVYYLLPMFLLAALIEGLGLILLGQQQLERGMTINRFTLPRVIVYEGVQGMMVLWVVFTGAICIKSFGNACHRRNHAGQSLLVMVHIVGPLLLLQLLNGIPGMNVWVAWLLGITLALGALYHAIPRIMQPDVPSAMGLFFSSAVAIFLLALVGRLLTYWYLTGDFKLLEGVVSTLAGKLPVD
jgi:hypothetical protein